MRTRTTLAATALVCAVMLTHCTASRAQDKMTPAEAKAIGKEAFLWGMHPVAIYHMRFNQLALRPCEPGRVALDHQDR